MKESGWNFQRINTMSISFHKSIEFNDSSYVRIPVRSSAIVIIKKDDKYCFIWSILASLYLCNNTQPNRNSNYIKYINKLNNNGFDSTNGFKCSDLHKFEKL